MYPFRTPLAHLGVESPDHRWLDPDGAWTLGLRAFVHNFGNQKPAGFILGLEVASSVLWAVGDSSDGALAADLDGGQRALSMFMDDVQWRQEPGNPRRYITGGRVRSAMIVTPAGYLWAGPSGERFGGPS